MFESTPSFALPGAAGQGWESQAGRLRLQAVNEVRKLRLQVRPDAQLDLAALEALEHIVLPTGPQGKAAPGMPVYWLAPHDWLLLDPPTVASRIGPALRQASGGASSVVTDVTDAWSIIDTAGADAAATLAQGCSVDLDDRVFAAGSYALTRLQHLPVILQRLDDPPRFRILVDRSAARFLWDWLRR